MNVTQVLKIKFISTDDLIKVYYFYSFFFSNSLSSLIHLVTPPLSPPLILSPTSPSPSGVTNLSKFRHRSTRGYSVSFIHRFNLTLGENR